MQINYNEKLNGIEVSFDSKPSATVLTNLKANGFRWHHTKKIWYAKDNAERRAMLNEIETKPVSKPKKAKSEIVNKQGVKVGDIFYICFGYEMTLYDFFQVVSVTENSCRVVEIPKNFVGYNHFYEQFKVETGIKHVPIEKSIWIKDQVNGDIKRTQVTSWDNSVYIKIDNHYARLYDGHVVEENHWD